MKAALLGASGGIGQPLSLLLKLNPRVTELALYDIKTAAHPCIGVAADISHINSRATVRGYSGEDELGACLEGSNVVIITAGIPRRPGMTRDDLFNINASIVKNLAEACAKYCPCAILLIITNPVNSTVPVACEVYKQLNIFDKRKVLGVTMLDCIRASTFVSQVTGLNPVEVRVPVVGGHAGETILPLFSKLSPPSYTPLSGEEIFSLDKHVQDAGTEVVNAKAGSGSATLSMAYAAAKFFDSVVNGLLGDDVRECCYLNVHDDEYMAVEVVLGSNGAESVIEITDLSKFETERLVAAKAKLAGDVRAGIDFISKSTSAS